MTSLLDDFNRAVAAHPNRIAIVDGTGRETTFDALQERATGLARAWHAQGIGKGDRVLMAMTLDADLYASLAALWSLGATVVLPEPAMGIKGLRHAARTSQATAFCSSGFYGLLKYALPELWRMKALRPRIKPHVKTGPAVDLTAPEDSDIALISFTSGTSGAPKAIPRSHGFLTAQHRAIAPLLHSDIAERDLVAFPVFVLINIASGQTSVLPNWKMSRLAKLTPSRLQNWVTDQSVSRALLPPALCATLAQAEIPPALHTVFTGGGPVFPDILDALKTAKPDLRLVCVYGSTEAEPIAHLDEKEIKAPHRSAMLSGAGLLVGRPVDDIRIRIVAHEIQVAGAHVNQGYLNPAHDAENKEKDAGVTWHKTGDAGHFDDAGQLWLLGRAASQVVIDGAPVFPFSIEVAARQWDGVEHCALIDVDAIPCLVIQGDARFKPIWDNLAADLGIGHVLHIPRMPLDKRHASKVDLPALRRICAKMI